MTLMLKKLGVDDEDYIPIRPRSSSDTDLIGAGRYETRHSATDRIDYYETRIHDRLSRRERLDNKKKKRTERRHKKQERRKQQRDNRNPRRPVLAYASE